MPDENTPILPAPNRIARTMFAPYLDRTVDELPARFHFFLSAAEQQGYDADDLWVALGGRGRPISAPEWDYGGAEPVIGGAA